eukprot:TRINITY_DN2534_c0_g1_i2.p1 TRINITY_DN2534_c0_g1~~TRINITY_DN2534_c0_g1_i2.p1  ORF type:complete len:345 (+),score=88.50 TRINITY_DN2534_c0_g1_i2:595-1629(+)
MFSSKPNSKVQKYLREEAIKIQKELDRTKTSEPVWKNNPNFMHLKQEQAERKKLSDHIQKQLKQTSIGFDNDEDDFSNQPINSSYQSHFVPQEIKNTENDKTNNMKLRKHHFELGDYDANYDTFVTTQQEEFLVPMIDNFDTNKNIADQQNHKTCIKFHDNDEPSFETTSQSFYKSNSPVNSKRSELKTTNRILQKSHVILGNEPQSFSTTSQEIASFTKRPSIQQPTKYNRQYKSNIILGDGNEIADYTTTSNSLMRPFDSNEMIQSRSEMKEDNLSQELQKSHTSFFGRNASQYKTTANSSYVKPPENAYQDNLVVFRKGKFNDRELEMKQKVLNAMNNYQK